MYKHIYMYIYINIYMSPMYTHYDIHITCNCV